MLRLNPCGDVLRYQLRPRGGGGGGEQILDGALVCISSRDGVLSRFSSFFVRFVSLFVR